MRKKTTKEIKLKQIKQEKDYVPDPPSLSGKFDKYMVDVLEATHASSTTTKSVETSDSTEILNMDETTIHTKPANTRNNLDDARTRYSVSTDTTETSTTHDLTTHREVRFREDKTIKAPFTARRTVKETKDDWNPFDENMSGTFIYSTKHKVGADGGATTSTKSSQTNNTYSEKVSVTDSKKSNKPPGALIKRNIQNLQVGQPLHGNSFPGNMLEACGTTNLRIQEPSVAAPYGFICGMVNNEVNQVATGKKSLPPIQEESFQITTTDALPNSSGVVQNGNNKKKSNSKIRKIINQLNQKKSKNTTKSPAPMKETRRYDRQLDPEEEITITNSSKAVKLSMQMKRNNQPKFFTTRTSLENFVLENILPSPKPSDSLKKKTEKSRSKERSNMRELSCGGEGQTSDNTKERSLWDEMKHERYQELHGRMQNSLSASMKMSPSMQVQASSTNESFFSFNSITDDDDIFTKIDCEDRFSPITTPIAYASQPGFLNVANPLHVAKGSEVKPKVTEMWEEIVRGPAQQSRNRADFWTSHEGGESKSSEYASKCDNGDKIEEARNERDEIEALLDELDIRDPPEGILTTPKEKEKPLDRIESTRESPTNEESANGQRKENHFMEKTSSNLVTDKQIDNQFSGSPRRFMEKFTEEVKRVGQLSPSRIQHTYREEKKELPDVSEPTNLQSKQTFSLKENTGMHVNTQIIVKKKETQPPGTPKLDQRTVRLLYANEFAEMVRMHSLQHVRQILAQNKGVKKRKPIIENEVSFAVRKRPSLLEEIEAGEFDVVDTPTDFSDAIVLYEAGIMPDRKTRDLKAHLFRFDAVFSDDVSSEEFYVRMGQPYVLAAVDGGYGTLVVMGSEGSGKSHLISDIEERAAFDVFADASYDVPSVSVRYLELYGSECIDQLGKIGNFVRIVEANGTYGVKGATAVNVFSAQELLLTIANAKKRHKTHRIVRKDNKYQSYLFCQIIIENIEGRGNLAIVECPSLDQEGYSETDVKVEEATPFACLMENLRAKASGSPLSATCNLTKLLYPALSSRKAIACVIGSVSPISSDTENTLDTLLSMKKVMKGNIDSNSKLWSQPIERASTPKYDESSLALPRQWSKTKLLDWMRQKRLLDPEVAEELHSVTEEQLSGRKVMRMTKLQLRNAFYKSVEDADKKGDKLFNALRGENDRIARKRVKTKRKNGTAK